MNEGMNSLEIERVLDYVIGLFPAEEDQENIGEHTHNESKVDQAIRLIEGGGKDENTERVIKVVHCGSVLDNDDRISIEFSSSELSSLEIHFLHQALEATEYSAQSVMREMRDTFKRADGMWKDCRNANK